MTTLIEALQQKSVRFIALIGRHQGLGIDANLRKPDLIAKVAPILAQADRLTVLSVSAQQCLADVLLAGARAPARLLIPQYGPLRSTEALTQAVRQQTPLSSLEELALAGLLFLDKNTRDLFIPADLISLLPTPTKPQPTLPLSTSGPEPIDLLGHDLTCLLALLQRERVNLLHGRWLPPHFLTTWGQYCRTAPITPAPRSELQTQRRRFLHYLAETAGLITGQQSAQATNDQQTVTLLPAAWQWLNASRPARLQTLWRAWHTPTPERWHRYRLPGYTWQSNPAALLPHLHQALLILNPAQPRLFARLMIKQQPHLIDLLPANALHRAATLTNTIIDLLTGPLCWLGVLHHTQAGLSLTPTGYAILNGQANNADSNPAPAKFTVHSYLTPNPLESSLTFFPPAALPTPSHLMTIVEVADIALEGNSISAFTLNSSAFILAVQRGWSPPALRQALNDLANRPLTGQEAELLRHWAGLAAKITLHYALLMETTDPAIITRLAATRRGRSLIRRTLSPRAVLANPAKAQQLIRRLTQQEGVPPKIVGAMLNDKLNPTGFFGPYALALYLAAQVYQRLGRYLTLPARIPQVALEQLTAQATPAQLAAAADLADQTLAALAHVIDGRAAFAPWPENNLPVAHSQAVIEQAISTGQNVRLHYYAPSSDTLMWRTVEPYRVEQRGNTPYLVGFCRHAQAERTFRLDRIKEIELTQN